jgi:N-acetylneuraminate synthase
MEPEEFANLVREGQVAKSAIGNSHWSMQESERESRRLRRSLYVMNDVKKGDVVSLKNVRAIRPGDGCSPKLLEHLIGQKFREDFKMGTPMAPELVEGIE